MESLWACPDHRIPLDDTQGYLRCPAGHRFDIIDGIPRFVARHSYADAFGLQWKTFPDTQLDSRTGVPLSRNRMRRCMGEEAWSRLPNSDVLEVGCGAGRFTEILLGERARVTSTDLSDAVTANRSNFPVDRNHQVAQADVAALPFSSRGFDLVLCLGVVQHTPNPEQTIAHLYEQVKPGGWLVLDHYSRRAAWYLSTGPLVRALVLRLPPDKALRATSGLVRRLWPIHARFRKHRRLLSRISPVATYFHVFPDLSQESQREWAFLDTHDALTDRFKWFRSEGQVRQALEALGCEGITTRRAGNGIEAAARRPAP
jgi:SAM-dependent methyltransferase